MSNLPPIYFYLPESDSLKEMPDVNTYWVGFRLGIFAWTLQTYLRLRAEGFPCQLVQSMPAEGIVIAHRDSLRADTQPGPKLLIVCLQADRGRHSYAQTHIVQNPKGLLYQIMLLGDKYLLPGGIYYMPHWPQPGLIPRCVDRGDRFENVAFFGVERNLAPQFKNPAWQKCLEDLGLKWHAFSDFSRWHDYSNVDVVVAVRSFDNRDYTWKPATKLYNAWHAGVPAVLGREPAFQAERKNELDYLEVNSIDDTARALKRLREDSALRRAMVENGKKRAQETHPQQIARRWQQLITEELVPEYEAWISSSWRRLTFIKRRQWAIQTRERRKRLQKLRNQMGLRTRLRSLLR